MTMRLAFLGKLLAWPKQHWKITGVAIILIALLGWWQYNRLQANQVDLKFVQPEYRDLTKVLEISGQVEAKEKARLRFVVGGKVTYVGAKEGDYVNKWQTIAVIDQATLRKQLQQDLNDYMKERWDWEETRDDIKNRAIATSERRGVDQEQWDLENTVLDVEIRDIAINNTVLSSPFGGVVTVAPTAVAGVNLLSTDYFEIVNPASLVFRAEVDEADIAQVAIAQSAEIFLDAYPDTSHQSQISYISFASQQSTSGTVFVVELPINSQDLNYFRIGMNGDVNVTLQTKNNALSIPLITIRQEDEKTLVDVKTGPETYQAREVKLGLETDEYVEVISGLNQDDQVLLPE